MHANSLNDPWTLNFLLCVDREIEADAAQQPCAYCVDRLHRTYYKRSPRFPGMSLCTSIAVRPSFCCQRDGCRRRMTPPQLRFLGRKVYVSVAILLVAAMTQGASAKRLRTLKSELGVSPSTVQRWIRYWRQTFVRQRNWSYHRGNFLPPIDETGLPLTLLARFEQSLGDKSLAIVGLLRLVNDCSLGPPSR